jgi:hypothetical protein
MYSCKCSTAHASGFSCSCRQNKCFPYSAFGRTRASSRFTADIDSFTLDFIACHPSSFIYGTMGVRNTIYTLHHFSREGGAMLHPYRGHVSRERIILSKESCLFFFLSWLLQLPMPLTITVFSLSLFVSAFAAPYTHQD